MGFDFIQNLIDFINSIIEKIKDFVAMVRYNNDNNAWGDTAQKKQQ